MAGVKIKFDGDKTQLEQAYRDLAAQHAKLENQVAKLGATSAKSAQEALKGQTATNGAVRAGISEAAQLVGSFLSVGGAIQAMTASMEEYKKIQADAMKEQLGSASPQKKVIDALAGKGPEVTKDTFEKLAKIQKDTKFGDINPLYQAFADAMSANGGKQKEALEAVRAAAPIARNSPADVAIIAQGASRIRDTLPHLTPEQAIAGQNSMGGPSAITNPAQQARWMPGAVQKGVNAFDLRSDKEREDTAKWVGTYFSAAGTAASDTEGASTATDTDDFISDLRNFITKGVKKTINGRDFNIKYGEGKELRTPQQMMEFIWSDAEANKAFLEFQDSEKKFELHRETFIKGGMSKKKFEEFAPQIRFDDKDYRDMQAAQEKATKQLELSTLSNEKDATEQQHKLANSVGARRAMARDIRDQAMANTREYSDAPFNLGYALEGFTHYSQDMVGREPVDIAIAELEMRKKQIRSPRGLFGGVDDLAPMKTDDQLTVKDFRQLEYLDENLKTLQRLKKETDREREMENAPANRGAAAGGGGGNLLHAIQEQTRIAQELGERQAKLTEEQNKQMQDLSRQLNNRKPFGNPRAEHGVHSER